MKGIFKSKARKAFLTAAISLALSSSVFAMPQGGVVRDGDVNISGVTTAANGTIDVTGLGLVDWNSFNLANGETLTFILKDAANGDSANLINRVVGQNMSEIYGHMVSQGEGGVYLVNPNGILIGNGAQIDVGSLLLAATNFTDANYQTLKDGGTLTLQTDPNMLIKVDSGAKIHFYDMLTLLGGKVQIADNVTISDGLARLSEDGTSTLSASPSNNVDFDVIAADKANINLNSDEWSASTTAGNDVTIGKANISVNDNSNAYIVGNTMTMNGTTLDFTPTDASTDSTALDIGAVSSVNVGKDSYTVEGSASNVATLNDVNATANYLTVAGGKVAVKNSTLTKVKGMDDDSSQEVFDNAVRLMAGTKAVVGEVDGVSKTLNLTTADDSSVTVSGSTLDSSTDVNVYGGTITVDGNSKVKADDFIDFIAGKTAYVDVTTDANKMEGSSANAIQLKDSTVTSGDGLVVYGGKIDVSNATLANTGTTGEIELDALTTYQSNDKGNDTWKATKDNAITLTDSKLTNTGTSEEEDNEIQLQGGSVTVSGATMQAKDILLTSRSHDVEDADSNYNYAETGMDTKISDSTLTADEEICVTGKTITVDGDTTLKAGNGTILAAGSEAVYKEVKDEAPEITVKDGTNVKLGKNVKIEGDSIIKPGKETIDDNTQPTTPTDPGTKPSEPTQPTTPTDPGTTPSEPTQPTTPTTPTTKDAAEVVAALEKSTTDEAKRAVIRASEPTAEATEVAKQKQSEESSTENVQVASVEAQDVLPTATESSTATVTVDGEAED